MEEKIKSILLDISADILGSLAISIGIVCFAESADIAPGGVSGISVMLRYLFGLPIGIMTFLINLPLIFVAFRFVGRSFALRSFRTLVINTVMLDFFVEPFVPAYNGDRMICAIFGGVLIGAGLGVVFLRGSSTAGTDIISAMIEKRFPNIQIGKAVMMIDCLIIGASAFVFKNIESVLFAVVLLFCQTKIINGIVYGTERGRNVLIISGKSEEIASKIMAELQRGATYLKAEGAYTGESTNVIMCVVRVWEYHEVKDIVYSVDPSAFLISSVAENIMGEGFSKAKGRMGI